MYETIGHVTSSSNGMTIEAFAATLLYSVTGIITLVVAVAVINLLFGFDIKRELVKDHNTSLGIVIAGMAVSIAIIIAGTISS